MFETVLLEATARARSQRRWTALLSVAVQVVLAGVLLILPMIAPEAIPELRSRIMVTVPRAQAAKPQSSPAPAGGRTVKPTHSGQIALRQPAEVPPTISMEPDDVPAAPSSSLPAGSCTPRCRAGVPDGVIGGMDTNFVPQVRQQPDPTPTRVVVSHLDPGFLLHRVQPVYPRIARLAGVQGPVVLRALISRRGEIQELRVISGHPFLSPAAREAVQQWRYRPYMLNGAAVEVETQVLVNFVLSER